MIGSSAHPRRLVRERVGSLQTELARLRAAAALIVTPADQTYLTGFRALLYSRPILLFVLPDCTAIVVPGLEEAHARSQNAADRTIVYYEHPDAPTTATWLECVDQVLCELPARSAIGVEYGGCSTGLAEHLAERGHPLVDLDPYLAHARARKDVVELEIIREAAAVTTTGVSAALAACRAGRTEIEVDEAGTAAVMAEVARFSGAVTVEQLIMTPSGRERSTLPHVYSTTRRLSLGDGLIHTRQVGLDGYRAELERTAFVGQPDTDQGRVFHVIREAQQRAIDAVRAGVTGRRIDDAARRVITDAALGAFALHRTGHGIGLSAHEPPYLRHDADAVLEEGMVITVEPGLYVPGLGGFRHSDTVIVTADGAELITDHPSDLASLTLGAQSTR